MSNSAKCGLVDVRGPKRYTNPDYDAANPKPGQADRMYPKAEVKAGGPFLAGSTAYPNFTPVKDGTPLQKADTDALGLAFKTKWEVKGPNDREFQPANLESEDRYQGTGGFEIGVHCDEEGSYAARGTLDGYGVAETNWTIK